MSFTEAETDYLRSQPLARLATVGPGGQPDVVPVAFEFDGAHIWIGGAASVTRTRKFRNLGDGPGRVALVVDDLVSLEPFVARGIRVYGRAEQPFGRTGMIGPGVFLRVTPTLSWSWNLEGDPVGDEWYPSRRTVHGRPGTD
ncbi:PPOX class F420-dependent oxidoreductase [Nocardiopsis tropica]|uniref:PPOX class F420-dependent oxidoreductase n=1 Tax=Nocardiopsis tropica TaxID=109330 RepID=A0ABU7KTU5_9ACTN|nr:PPOX class F420-dependent oxidoreductase [Nocardiopsis umidischolae]MEE2052720.1 PPOX class F420-dependent oxidoreductase [Nocardiopsis umidischolae]